MVDYAPYIQDLRRYARVWLRVFPAMVFWCNNLKAWEMMLAPPQSRVRADRGNGVTSQKVITLYAAWLGATRELIRYQQALAMASARQLWMLKIPFNPLLLGAATRPPYSGSERTTGPDQPAAPRVSSVTALGPATKAKRPPRAE